ncbi:MAG: hypothetical protein Q9227_002326 [Pyrenula ochraceoflavens]
MRTNMNQTAEPRTPTEYFYSSDSEPEVKSEKDLKDRHSMQSVEPTTALSHPSTIESVGSPTLNRKALTDVTNVSKAPSGHHQSSTRIKSTQQPEHTVDPDFGARRNREGQEKHAAHTAKKSLKASMQPFVEKAQSSSSKFPTMPARGSKANASEARVKRAPSRSESDNQLADEDDVEAPTTLSHATADHPAAQFTAINQTDQFRPEAHPKPLTASQTQPTAPPRSPSLSPLSSVPSSRSTSPTTTTPPSIPHANTPTDPLLPLLALSAQLIHLDNPPHSTYLEITIHTAKCDLCETKNTGILYRCRTCAMQICRGCVLEKEDADKLMKDGEEEGEEEEEEEEEEGHWTTHASLLEYVKWDRKKVALLKADDPLENSKEGGGKGDIMHGIVELGDAPALVEKVEAKTKSEGKKKRKDEQDDVRVWLKKFTEGRKKARVEREERKSRGEGGEGWPVDLTGEVDGEVVMADRGEEGGEEGSL